MHTCVSFLLPGIHPTWPTSHLSRGSSGVTSPVSFPKPPMLSNQKKFLSPLSWQQYISEFSHALCQELWRKWIFISSQARKLACQLHAGRRQENHGLETMGFINHSTASNTRFMFRLVLLLFSPVVWSRERKRVQSRQWNPKYREFESIDGLRANPSTLVPEGSVIFITLDNKQAHALLCVEMPTLSSKALPLYSLGEDKWERKGS